MRWVLWLMRAPVDLVIHWNLAWLQVAQELLEWPAALCNEAARHALEERENEQ